MLHDSVVSSILNVKVLETHDLIGLKIQAYKNDPDRELQDKADIQFLLNNTSVD